MRLYKLLQMFLLLHRFLLLLIFFLIFLVFFHMTMISILFLSTNFFLLFFLKKFLILREFYVTNLPICVNYSFIFFSYLFLFHSVILGVCHIIITPHGVFCIAHSAWCPMPNGKPAWRLNAPQVTGRGNVP